MPNANLLVNLTADAESVIGSQSNKSTVQGKVSAVLSSGTGPGKFEKMGSVQGSLVDAATQTVDLQAITAPFTGDPAIVFTKIKGIVIRNLATEATYNLLVGGAGANPWDMLPTPVTVPPGGCIMLMAAYSLGDGLPVSPTNKDILIEADIVTPGTGTEVDFDVTMVGDE